jgi:hypothetical protein
VSQWSDSPSSSRIPPGEFALSLVNKPDLTGGDGVRYLTPQRPNSLGRPQVQTPNSTGLKSVKCRFESNWGHGKPKGRRRTESDRAARDCQVSVVRRKYRAPPFLLVRAMGSPLSDGARSWECWPSEPVEASPCPAPTTAVRGHRPVSAALAGRRLSPPPSVLPVFMQSRSEKGEPFLVIRTEQGGRASERCETPPPPPPPRTSGVTAPKPAPPPGDDDDPIVRSLSPVAMRR